MRCALAALAASAWRRVAHSNARHLFRGWRAPRALPLFVVPASASESSGIGPVIKRMLAEHLRSTPYVRRNEGIGCPRHDGRFVDRGR